MKKILVIHTKYRTKGGEYSAYQNDLAELKKKFEVKSINLTNKEFMPFSDTFNVLFNRNKELVKHFNELETNFKPDYYYFHNTWFKAAGIVTYLLKADRFVILKLHNFRFDCIQGAHYRKNKLCFKCSRSPFFGIVNRCYRNSIIMSLIISLFTHRFRKSLLHPNVKVLALNSFQYKYLLDFGVKNENLLLQYNFLENNRVEINSKYRNKKKEFVYLGRVTENKGTFELLECFKDLNREDYILNIIGKNDNSVSLEKFRNSKNIIFHGYQKSSFINQKLKSSLAVISATKSLELHPMIINDSVKNKCLLIFPDIPGLLDFFPENYEFLYKHSNFNNLKSTINSLIEKYENSPETLDKQIDILSSHINDLLDPDKLIRNFMDIGNE